MPRKQLLHRHRVRQLCQQFVAQFGGLSHMCGHTQETATNCCYVASKEFQGFVVTQGYRAYLAHCNSVTLPTVAANEWDDPPGFAGHWLVWLPGVEMGVDWTARQFWPRVRHPLILQGPDHLARYYTGISKSDVDVRRESHDDIVSMTLGRLNHELMRR